MVGPAAQQVRTSSTRRLFVMVGLCVALLSGGFSAAASAADEAPPSVRYAVGSPAMQAAQAIAREYWSTDACGGQVDVSWDSEQPRINARSFWSNPTSAYDNPTQNGNCRVVLNEAVAFDWDRFCTVLVHEYGHLTGHPHTDDGAGVMSPIYRRPLPACTGVSDPSARRSAASRASTRATVAKARKGKSRRAHTASRRR